MTESSIYSSCFLRYRGINSWNTIKALNVTGRRQRTRCRRTNSQRLWHDIIQEYRKEANTWDPQRCDWNNWFSASLINYNCQMILYFNKIARRTIPFALTIASNSRILIPSRFMISHPTKRLRGGFFSMWRVGWRGSGAAARIRKFRKLLSEIPFWPISNAWTSKFTYDQAPLLHVLILLKLDVWKRFLLDNYVLLDSLRPSQTVFCQSRLSMAKTRDRESSASLGHHVVWFLAPLLVRYVGNCVPFGL